MNFQKPWCQTKERKKKKFLILTQKENNLPNEKNFLHLFEKNDFSLKEKILVYSVEKTIKSFMLVQKMLTLPEPFKKM